MKRTINSQADILFDLERLVAAARENAAILPSAEPHRQTLEKTLQDLKDAKLVQEAHKAVKQKATQSLRELLVQADELARRLRTAVVTDLGPRNEQLVNFGITPLRAHKKGAVDAAKKANATTPLAEIPKKPADAEAGAVPGQTK